MVAGWYYGAAKLGAAVSAMTTAAAAARTIFFIGGLRFDRTVIPFEQSCRRTTPTDIERSGILLNEAAAMPKP